MCIAAGAELRELLSAHNDLIDEVNTLRSQLGIPARDALRAPSAAFTSLMDMEDQTHGESPDDSKSSSRSESYEPQPLAWQSEAQTLPFEPSVLPDPILPDQAFAQYPQIDAPSVMHDVVPSVPWEAQAPGYFSSLSSVPIAHIPDTYLRWQSNVSRLKFSDTSCDISPNRMLPWEQEYSNMLQGNLESAFVPFSRAYHV